MESPLREIVALCGEEPSVVLNQVKQGTGSYGYNAATGEYGDMIAMGILDPTKVTRTASQNAASIAGPALAGPFRYAVVTCSEGDTARWLRACKATLSAGQNRDLLSSGKGLWISYPQRDAARRYEGFCRRSLVSQGQPPCNTAVIGVLLGEQEHPAPGRPDAAVSPAGQEGNP